MIDQACSLFTEPQAITETANYDYLSEDSVEETQLLLVTSTVVFETNHPTAFRKRQREEDRKHNEEMWTFQRSKSIHEGNAENSIANTVVVFASGQPTMLNVRCIGTFLILNQARHK